MGPRMKRRAPRAPTPAWAVDLETGEVIEQAIGRPAEGRKAFGLQIHLARCGEFSKAIALFCGTGKDPDPEAIKVEASLVRALAACPTEKTRRGVAELHYMLAAELRMMKGGYRCQGSEVFFGRQHELLGGVDDKGRPLRRYVPKDAQEGLTKRLRACTRTIFRWWAVLVRNGVWKSWRPGRDAPGAMLTASGAQVYSQRTLVGGTPRAAAAQLPLRNDKRARAPGHAGPMRGDELRAALAWIDGHERFLL
jgi:hypothetical protein